jgi:cytoskeletal protein CcmA (bactofilin family)
MSIVSNYLKNKNIEFYIGIVNFILILFLLYYNFNKKEGFAVTDDVNTAIIARYGADVDAIRNLSDIATKLTISGGLVVPGGLQVNGAVSFAGGKILIDANGNVTINSRVNIKGDLDVSGNIALNDNSLILRGMGDRNHTIRWDASMNGPLITGCTNVGIKTNSCQTQYRYGLVVDGSIKAKDSIQVATGSGFIQLNSTNTTAYGKTDRSSIVSSKGILHLITPDPTGNSGHIACGAMEGQFLTAC